MALYRSPDYQTSLESTDISREKVQHRFWKFLAIFDLQVATAFPTTFRANLPLGSGEVAQNRFSRWPPWQPSWISHLNDFSYIDLQEAPTLPTQFRVHWLIRSAKWIFKIATMVAILEFWSEQFLLFLICKLPRYFLLSFKSTDLSVREKMSNIDFQDGSHLGFPIRMIFAFIWSASYPDTSYKVLSQLTFQCRRRAKQIFMTATMVAIFDFGMEQF